MSTKMSMMSSLKALAGFNVYDSAFSASDCETLADIEYAQQFIHQSHNQK